MFVQVIEGQIVPIVGSFAVGDAVHPASNLLHMTAEEAEALGVFSLPDPEPPPSGQREVSRALAMVNDKPGWIVATESIPLADLKAAKRQAVETEYATRLAIGFPLPGHPGQTLQCRTDHDRTNWIGLMLKCQMMVAAGAGAQPCDMPLRTTANLGVQFTYAETLQIMLAILQWSAAMLGARWALKDACDTAATAEDLAAIDLSSGWPA